MKIGVVGLGLIGGSLAKAYKRTGKNTVLATDSDKTVLAFAQIAEAVDVELTTDNISTCELIFLCLYPQSIIDWLVVNAPYISKNTIVIDCGGTKENICTTCFPLAEKYGFHFFGGHPMAGTHKTGFKYSREDLFDDAPMVIVPPNFDDIALMDRVKISLKPLGFSKISITTAKQHDEIIAFTSQMPHIISNAYIKSPTSLKHKGYSAGSYKDLTRVAWLNPAMWTNLFLDNKEHVLNELDVFICEISKYRKAIEDGDAEFLENLLKEGRDRKQEVDGL